MGYKALVVDDSDSMRQLIVFALRRLKTVQVVEAHDAMEAIKQLQTERYDLVVTDLNMPVMDGFKLVSAIRNNEQHRDAAVVVITTEAGEADRRRAMSLGANAYIAKPIQAAHVTDTARALLGL